MSEFQLNGQIEVKPFSTEGGLSEIYRQGWQGAFVSANFEQAHPLCLCKDFFQDAVRAHLYKNSSSIHGFTYDSAKNPPLDLKVDVKVLTETNKKNENKEEVTVVGKTRLLVGSSSDKNFRNLQANVADFIRQFESRLGLDLTEIYEVTNPQNKYKEGGMFVYVSSPRWMEAPPLLSLYTLLLRVGCVHTIGDQWLTTLEKLANGQVKGYQTNDANYVKRSLATIKNIMKIGYRPIFYKNPFKNYPKELDINSLHHSSGIVALSEGQTDGICKFWRREELNKKPSIEDRRNKQVKAASVSKTSATFGQV
jgi:hypothetical protein